MNFARVLQVYAMNGSTIISYLNCLLYRYNIESSEVDLEVGLLSNQ